MQARKRSFFEEFTVAFAKPALWEKCRELSRILPLASPNELHVVFPQICGDVFGYGAGGVGFGWNLASMTRSGGGGSSSYSGLGQNYRDYSSALSFLGSNGSFFSVIHRLMHDPSHLYEFPVSQLPPGYHKTRGLSTITGGPTSGTIPLTAFEFYFYHFVSLLVRRQQLGLAPTNVNVNASSETLFILLLEDYLTCFLPIDPVLQAKLFTQNFQAATNTQQSPQPTIKQPSPNSNRPSLFKKTFSPIFKGDENTGQDVKRANDVSKSLPASSETWRSDTLVKILVMFWIEGYAGEDALNDANSPTVVSQGSASSLSDYVSASIKVASSLASAEQMRVVRMFIKHSHYFANACHQGSVYLPAAMKVDIFSSKMNKILLCAYFGKAIDHWPYDASFRLVLETWLSYIQPWRYLNNNNGVPEDENAIKMDPVRFSNFVSDNYMFYTKLLSKVLRRFQRLEISSPKNAFMLFRVLKVISQENLFPCIKSAAMAQGHLLQRHDKSKGARMENIFSHEFNEFSGELLTTALKCLEMERRQKNAADMAKNGSKSSQQTASGFSTFITSVVTFINGGSLSGTDVVADSERAEREKVVQYLTFITEKLSLMFELDYVLKQFKTLPPDGAGGQLEKDSTYGGLTQENEAIDQTDDLLSSPGNFGLSPSQRKGILFKKFVATCRYQGNPDLLPIRSDEFTFLVRALHLLCGWINTKFSKNINEAYHRNNCLGSVMREILTGPSTYLTNGRSIDQIDSSFNSSFHGLQKQPVKLPPRLILRPLASYFVVTYLTVAFLFLSLIIGKSMIGTLLILFILFASGVVIKAFVNPTSEIKTGHNDTTSELFLSDMLSK